MPAARLWKTMEPERSDAILCPPRSNHPGNLLGLGLGHGRSAFQTSQLQGNENLVAQLLMPGRRPTHESSRPRQMRCRPRTVEMASR
jgi:hypothetical protein